MLRYAKFYSYLNDSYITYRLRAIHFKHLEKFNLLCMNKYDQAKLLLQFERVNYCKTNIRIMHMNKTTQLYNDLVSAIKLIN
jgi:hypothetical protein